MRATRRAVATSMVVAVAMFLAACEPTPTPEVSRDRGTAWLVNQFGADDLIPASFDPDQDDLSGTAYAVTNLIANGTGKAVARRAAAALAARVEDFVVDGSGHDLPGSLARLILVARATKLDPRNFGGVNLVARLEATMQTSGPDKGLFGVQSATYDGAFRQGLALAALSVVKPRPASLKPGHGTIEALPAVKWLIDQQCDDGSWMYRPDTGVPCAFDPNTFAGPDTNSTALAVLGLESINAIETEDAGAWLASVKATGGGWSYDGSPGSSADPDSTGLVVAALAALGTPADQQSVNKLVSFQFGPSAAGADRGAFWYPPFDAGPKTPNLQATNDALVGLSPSVWPGVLVGK